MTKWLFTCFALLLSCGKSNEKGVSGTSKLKKGSPSTYSCYFKGAGFKTCGEYSVGSQEELSKIKRDCESVSKNTFKKDSCSRVDMVSGFCRILSDEKEKTVVYFYSPLDVKTARFACDSLVYNSDFPAKTKVEWVY